MIGCLAPTRHPEGPSQNNPMNSDADASLPTSLLFLDIPLVCFVIAPCRQGASASSVRSGYFLTDPERAGDPCCALGHAIVPSSEGSLLALALLVLLPSPALADDWTGADKFYHFSASLAVGSAAFSGAALTWEGSEEPGWSAVSAGAVAFVGIGKELFDLGSGGDFSGKDLAWDAAGGAVAIGLNLLIWTLVGG